MSLRLGAGGEVSPWFRAFQVRVADCRVRNADFLVDWISISVMGEKFKSTLFYHPPPPPLGCFTLEMRAAGLNGR